MADTVTFSFSIAIKRDSTAQTIGIALGAQTLNLAAVPELDGSQKTLSTSYQALDFDEVGMNEITWSSFKNHSTTDAEVVTLSKLVGLSDGFATDSVATIDGASVPNTPATGGAGRYRTITSDGSSQGIAWKTGDRAVYLGSSGVWGRIPVSEFAEIPKQMGILFKPKADSLALYAKSASGTPQLGWSVAGALA